MAATAIVGYFVKEYHDNLTKSDPEIDPYNAGQLGRFEFFLYATSVGIIIAAVGLVAFLSGLHEKGPLAVSSIHNIFDKVRRNLTSCQQLVIKPLQDVFTLLVPSC